MFDKWVNQLKKAQEREEEIVFQPYNEEIDEITKTQKAPSQAPEEVQSASVCASSSETNIELKVVRPEAFADVSTVADHLLDGRTVVLNVEALDPATCRRMLDFLNGVTYSLNGDIKMVAQSTYILTPNNVDVSGD